MSDNQILDKLKKVELIKHIKDYFNHQIINLNLKNYEELIFLFFDYGSFSIF
jgi:hypothetical protein